MWPDRVSNPGSPTYESDALPTALRGPAKTYIEHHGLPGIFYLMAAHGIRWNCTCTVISHGHV